MKQLFKQVAGMENEYRQVVVQMFIEKNPVELMEYFKRATEEYMRVITQQEIENWISVSQL